MTELHKINLGKFYQNIPHSSRRMGTFLKLICDSVTGFHKLCLCKFYQNIPHSSRVVANFLKKIGERTSQDKVLHVQELWKIFSELYKLSMQDCS